jgi:hypothetical protein
MRKQLVQENRKGRLKGKEQVEGKKARRKRRKGQEEDVEKGRKKAIEHENKLRKTEREKCKNSGR